MGKNYYDVLGLPKGTSDAAKIKKAYRKLALRFHPDKPTGDTAKFQGTTVCNLTCCMHTWFLSELLGVWVLVTVYSALCDQRAVDLFFSSSLRARCSRGVLRISMRMCTLFARLPSSKSLISTKLTESTSRRGCAPLAVLPVVTPQKSARPSKC